MKHNDIVFEYHERTKHHPNRYAVSLGYLDWATQPDPFRRYQDSDFLKLKLALKNPTPPYHLIFEKDTVPSASLTRESLSQFLQFSMGLSAWKSIGSDRWALRCNASSGNLHPTEAYIIAPPVSGISDQSIVSHYAPKEHGIEQLAIFDTDFWNQLPQGSFLVGLSSILWREAWKYGERSFRYCQLDAGHAWQAIDVSAKMLGWHCNIIDTEPAAILDRLLGLDQQARFISEEKESADMLLLISPSRHTAIDFKSLLSALPQQFEGKANRLSPSHHQWEAVELIERATHIDQIHEASSDLPSALSLKRLPSEEAKEIVLTRRSAQAMDFGRADITKEALMTLLQSTQEAFGNGAPAVDLVLFVHHIETLESGLYIFIRNREHLLLLKKAMRSDLLWKEVETGLYLLEAGNVKPQSKFISCDQDIASDSAFSLGMLCEFEPQIEKYGAHRYKELYWECGALGQQLYLESTSLKLSATGIGCFLDDVMHRLLGLKDQQFQVLYHFTIGRAIIDMRLSTEPPYLTG